ncbi:hypothetical protein KY084_04040 [Stakelama sp. CBK3Z-3]|uniref:Terminase small subunit n=1 Tax=Stakelama flava TaxID=2860338 RepID=A0ABS6XJQ9_9SPHN|nr:hypothetical protein [Stakelama flava]MBW4330043.1 hypothetical protein [Stakelama flava]
MATDEMKKPRRRRADSKEAAVQDMLNAERDIHPPADFMLTAAELVAFDEIVIELPRGEWTPHMIRVAAGLARDMEAYAREMASLCDEGGVVSGAGGGPVQNPRVTITSALLRRILATRRSLSIHCRAKAGMDNRVLSRRREIQRENEGNGLDDDEGLIAKPQIH